MQSYLRPLPLSVAPVFWSHEQALRLYPVPHAVCAHEIIYSVSLINYLYFQLIVGDRHDIYHEVAHGCVTMNPGPFAVNNYQFLAYFPATCSAEYR